MKPAFLRQLRVNRFRLSSKEDVEILQVGKPLANVLEIVVCRVVSIEVKIFAIALFTREQQGNSWQICKVNL